MSEQPTAEQRAERVFVDHINHHALYEHDAVAIPQAIADAIRAAERDAAERQYIVDCEELCAWCILREPVELSDEHAVWLHNGQPCRAGVLRFAWFAAHPEPAP